MALKRKKRLKMGKNRTKHFVPKPYPSGDGFAACDFRIYAVVSYGEVAETRQDVDCRRCRNTKVFRKLK